MNAGTKKNFNYDSRAPELVLCFGAGLYYKVNDKPGITAELIMHQCQNDRLDDYVKNDDFDQYSLMTIGLSYHINNFKIAPLKNQARHANSSFLFNSPVLPATP
jgi:hypothetical protein